MTYQTYLKCPVCTYSQIWMYLDIFKNDIKHYWCINVLIAQWNAHPSREPARRWVLRLQHHIHLDLSPCHYRITLRPLDFRPEHHPDIAGIVAALLEIRVVLASELLHPQNLCTSPFFVMVQASQTVLGECRLDYRGVNKGLFVLLSRTQAGPGRTVQQEQEEISRNKAKIRFS